MSLELGLCCSIVHRAGELIPSDKAEMEKKSTALVTFSLGLESEKCRYQQGNAMNWMGCKGEVDSGPQGKKCVISSLSCLKPLLCCHLFQFVPSHHHQEPRSWKTTLRFMA